MIMKVAHILPTHLTKAEMLGEAKEAEAMGDFDKAASYYQKVIKTDPHNEIAYNRLMIIYRKRKEFKDELDIVNKAIHAFEELHASSVKTSSSKKVSNLSNAFLKATGLADKNGKLLHVPEPLGKWMRRKALLEKKLGKS